MNASGSNGPNDIHLMRCLLLSCDYKSLNSSLSRDLTCIHLLWTNSLESLYPSLLSSYPYSVVLPPTAPQLQSGWNMYQSNQFLKNNLVTPDVFDPFNPYHSSAHQASLPMTALVDNCSLPPLDKPQQLQRKIKGVETSSTAQDSEHASKHAKTKAKQNNPKRYASPPYAFTPSDSVDSTRCIIIRNLPPAHPNLNEDLLINTICEWCEREAGPVGYIEVDMNAGQTALVEMASVMEARWLITVGTRTGFVWCWSY